MFENPRRGRQARNFTTNVPKILVLKSSSEQIFSRKLPLGAPVLVKRRRRGHGRVWTGFMAGWAMKGLISIGKYVLFHPSLCHSVDSPRRNFKKTKQTKFN